MTGIQFIEKDGKREYAIVPIEVFERLMEAVGGINDIFLYHATKTTGNGTNIPPEIMSAITNGIHPIKAWRKYRKLNLQALADKAGISKPILSQIERRKRAGTIAVISAIARSLDVPVDLVAE
jgi:DNA-binding XRE family transcriptional regulator